MSKRGIVVYVAGKYTAKTDKKIQKNILVARNYASKLWDLGFTVICPHMNTANFENNGETQYEDFMQGDFELIHRSNVVFMLPKWTESQGATREREFAIKTKKPVFYSLEKIAEYDIEKEWD